MAFKKKSVAGTKDDPTIKFAKLVIDEKEYQLGYSFNAIAEAEAAAGCNLLNGLQSLNGMSALQLRGLLFAALRIAQPEIVSIDEVGLLLRLDTIGDVQEALAEAYLLSMPEKKSKEPVVDKDDQKTT